MSEDEFTKLFKYMSKRFGKVDASLESKANQKDMDKVLGLLNALAKR